MNEEEIVLQPGEEYDFFFTQADLELLRDANLRPVRSTLVCMGIGLAVALVLLWTDALGDLASGLLLGMMVYGCMYCLLNISNYKKAFRESMAHVLVSRYHYCVYDDHLTISVYRDQTMTKLLHVDYSAMRNVRDHGRLYSFVCDQGGYMVPKVQLRTDSPFAAALREKAAPPTTSKKRWHTIANVSLWAAILSVSTPVALIRWIPGLEADSSGQIGLMLLFLLLPILSIVIGIALRNQGIRWKRNVIIGVVAAALLLLNAGMVFFSAMLDAIADAQQMDTTYLAQTEEILSMDFPEPQAVTNVEYDAYTVPMMNGRMRYASHCYFLPEEMRAVELQMEEDDRWLQGRVQTELMGLFPAAAYPAPEDRILLYNMDRQEFNQVPTLPGTYCFLLAQYSAEGHFMSIFVYEVEYIP